MIANRRRVMGGVDASLPYDAEVEYLQFTGTQWLDTGISLKDVGQFEMEYEFAPTRYWNFNNIMAMDGANGTQFESWAYYQNNTGYYAFRYRGVRAPTGNTLHLPTDSLSVIKITYDSNSKKFELWCNNELEVSQVYNNYSTPYSGNETIWLGRRNNYAEMLLASYKLTFGNTPVLDMKAVRVGQIGYMYDRVSGQLLGNAGSGAFVIGPDKT